MGIKYIDDQLGGNVAVKHGVTTFPSRGTLAIDGDNVDVTDTGSLIQVDVHPEHVVATVTDLRALGASVGERVILADPGGGVFERVASGTDNGGTVFVSTGYGTTGAAWKRIYSGPIEAEWFGVKGDCLEGSGDTTIGSPVVHVDTFSFTSADVGKLFAIDAAGAAGKSLVGTILSVAGQDVTLNVSASSTQSNKPCRWGTNDAPNLRRWLKAQNDTLLGILPYHAQGAHLRGGKAYFVHNPSGNACLDLNSYQKLTADHHAALVAASDDDIILNCAVSNNEVRNIQFKFGLHAIQFFGRADTYSGQYIGHPQNAESVNKFAGCYFYYQHGPSIWQDTSNAGPPTARRVIAGHIEISNYIFFGNTLCLLMADGIVIQDGWLISDTDRYPVLWDDGRPMGAIVTSDALSVINVSAAPVSSTDAAWFEGNGHIVTKGFRAGGENGRPCFAVRTEGLTYKGQTMLEVADDPTENCSIYTDCDAWASTSNRHFIEIYDVFPARISIQRVENFDASGSSQRKWGPFGNPDCTIWINSDNITLSDLYAKNSVGMQIDIDVGVPYRYVYSNDPTSFDGIDLTPLFVTHEKRRNNAQEAPRAEYNYWWTTGTGNFPFDASWGVGSSLTGSLAIDTIQIYGYDVRRFTSTIAPNTSFFNFYLDNSGPTKWGASVPEGFYTLSIFVVANYAGWLNFSHDASNGVSQVRRFVASDRPQRLSWTFWHDGGADVSLALTSTAMPGTIGTAGSIALGLPMINSGQEAAEYMVPGLAIASAGDSGDSHDFGSAMNGGRSVTGRLNATAAGSSAETDGTITLAMNGVYDLVAHFRGRDGSGNCFAGTRRAVFKRHSGTTTQLGTTETLGSDQVDASAAGWLATLDNSSSDLRFRTTSASGVVWEVTWELELRVI